MQKESRYMSIPNTIISHKGWGWDELDELPDDLSPFIGLDSGHIPNHCVYCKILAARIGLVCSCPGD